MEFSGALYGDSYEFSGNSWAISGQLRGFFFGKIWVLGWFRAIWALESEEEKSEDHDHMRTKPFSRESWSWSSFFSSSEADFQRTMTICVARLLRGNLGHGHRLFLSQNEDQILTPTPNPRIPY